jgi:hypothetical protein
VLNVQERSQDIFVHCAVLPIIMLCNHLIQNVRLTPNIFSKKEGFCVPEMYNYIERIRWEVILCQSVKNWNKRKN